MYHPGATRWMRRKAHHGSSNASGPHGTALWALEFRDACLGETSRGEIHGSGKGASLGFLFRRHRSDSVTSWYTLANASTRPLRKWLCIGRCGRWFEPVFRACSLLFCSLPGSRLAFCSLWNGNKRPFSLQQSPEVFASALGDSIFGLFMLFIHLLLFKPLKYCLDVKAV